VVARCAGVGRVLISCHEVNVASAAVIERCGGVLEDVRVSDDGRWVRRYWVEAPGSGDLVG
jgi:predicted acetyltransferase